ncbi:hypothetical protein AJ88_26505 [Mesorhizobium amorphae CCBAU 01583]|nr:hypothetical protein AJ88_26505 [Mesorhizobium amorphae CCBAU 01583]
MPPAPAGLAAATCVAGLAFFGSLAAADASTCAADLPSLSFGCCGSTASFSGAVAGGLGLFAGLVSAIFGCVALLE